MLSGGSAVIKYLIFIFNGIFVVTGLAILSVGAVIQARYWNYQHFLDNKYFSAPNLLIAIGVIVLVVSFFGCCGALKENYCMILAFTALLIVIFILELAGGIAGYVLRDSATEVLTEKLKATMPNYGTDKNNETTAIWDLVQREFQCCGVDGPKDWTVNNTDHLPWSCCAIPTGKGDFTCKFVPPTTAPPTVKPAEGTVTTLAPSQPLPFYGAGCVDKFGDFVRENAVVIGGAGIGIAFVELLGVVLSCRLAIVLRRNGSPLM